MDFLALEEPLIARLAEKVRFNGEPVDVEPARSLRVDAGNEPVLRVPALLVSYDGYTVPESSRGKARVRQKWSVIAVVANLRDRARIGARDDGALLLDEVITWLLGWVPPPSDGRAFHALELTDPSSAVSYGARNTYLPLSFITERSVKGQRAQPGATP